MSKAHPNLSIGLILLPLITLVPFSIEKSQADGAANLYAYHFDDEGDCGNSDGCNNVTPGLQYEHRLWRQVEGWIGGAYNSEKKISGYGILAAETPCRSVLCFRVGVGGGFATSYNRGWSDLGIVPVAAPTVGVSYRGIGVRAIPLLGPDEKAVLFQLTWD